MVSTASGLATTGWQPYVATVASFLALLACEQIRTDVAYTKLPVRLIGHHAGITLGYCGTSHHATEDLAITRSIAGLTVIAPADAAQLRSALRAAADWPRADLLPHRPRTGPGCLRRRRPGLHRRRAQRSRRARRCGRRGRRRAGPAGTGGPARPARRVRPHRTADPPVPALPARRGGNRPGRPGGGEVTGRCRGARGGPHGLRHRQAAPHGRARSARRPTMAARPRGDHRTRLRLRFRCRTALQAPSGTGHNGAHEEGASPLHAGLAGRLDVGDPVGH